MAHIGEVDVMNGDTLPSPIDCLDLLDRAVSGRKMTRNEHRDCSLAIRVLREAIRKLSTANVSADG